MALSRAGRVLEFIDRYILVPEGKMVGQPLKLDKFQIKFIRAVYDNKALTRRAVLSIARKNGKALALDTPIPTPSGWTTMGELREGDQVFSDEGKPCTVTLKTPVQHNRVCYRVTFSDGETVVADAEHQWDVRWKTGLGGTRKTVTTQQMVDTVPPDSSNRTYPWSVPVTQPLQLPDAELPVPPYTLGAWLGDGCHDGAQLTLGTRDAAHIIERVQAEGWPARATRTDRGATYVSLSDGVKHRAKDLCPLYALRDAGLLYSKRIPEQYQRASLAQRRALLCGLMDTDGFVSKTGQCNITQSREELARDIWELACGLGYKATMREERARLNGVDHGPAWTVDFWALAGDGVVSVPFKAERLRTEHAGNRLSWKAIVSIEPVASVPVACITVGSPNAGYLFGRTYTVTHNTALIAALILAHLIGPERQQNSQIASGALSRDQASIVFKLALKMLQLQPAFEGLYKAVPSSKVLMGLRSNTEFRALSAEGGSNMGLSPLLLIIDEAGQVVGPTSPFLEAVLTSQGAHENPLTIIISTQAPSDADFLSLIIDDAMRSGDPHTVCHVYEADKDCELLDKKQWKKANPSSFRSPKDLEEQLKQASRIPALEASSRNLLLNQRVSLNSLWLAPSVWKINSGEYDLSVFQDFGAHIGLDLSQRHDLTAAVLAARDLDGFVHLKSYAFTPMQGLSERAARDRAPYDAWVRSGDLIAVPGATIDYEWICGFLKLEMERLGVDVNSVQFDRWRINEFKAAAERVGFNTWSWAEVGQGYKDISPRLESFETALLQGKIRHGNSPTLNLGAASAIVVRDPAGNKKLDKAKASQKIDVLVAAVMAAYPLISQVEQDFSVEALIA